MNFPEIKKKTLSVLALAHEVFSVVQTRVYTAWQTHSPLQYLCELWVSGWVQTEIH